MKVFKLDKNYSVVCVWEKTRYGFRHIATLIKNGVSVSTAKACYQNRTWEKFEYETVLINLISSYFESDKRTKNRFLRVIDKGRD